MASRFSKYGKYFPLKYIDDVIELFSEELKTSTGSPNIAFLSIVIGAVECSLTISKNKAEFIYDVTEIESNKERHSNKHNLAIPTIRLNTIETLYRQFESSFKSVNVAELIPKDSKYAARSLVKRVADIVWNNLSRSFYKDRAHIQTLYSYLNDNKLDCFGVACAVVAACQLLGFEDVNLALSEDHAWVTFGEDGQDTAEVSWHGKASEDKRGTPVNTGEHKHSWLYLSGYPIKCTRKTEVASLVSSINPALTASTDCVELCVLQQRLLWLLYDASVLDNYPMAVDNLADLEEVCPTEGRPSCRELMDEAIEIARTKYENQHVYPYTYLGGYLYRRHEYKEALSAWADAADVLRKYNYNSREDEEIYKEFLEVGNELIPTVIREASSGHSARSLIKDPECFAYLLRFYDGICQWEEDSSCPILHIGWAKPLVASIAKFDAEIRGRVRIVGSEEREARLNGEAPKTAGQKMVLRGSKVVETPKRKSDDRSVAKNNGTFQDSDEADAKELIETLESKLGENMQPHPVVEALAAECTEKILSREYLLGHGGNSPFEEVTSITPAEEEEKEVELMKEETEAVKSDSIPKVEITPPSEAIEERGATREGGLTESGTAKETAAESCIGSEDTVEREATSSRSTVKKTVNVSSNTDISIEPVPLDRLFTTSPQITLHSQKMRGLRDVLLAEKLNTQAISLQLTAQSQVQVSKRSSIRTEFYVEPRSKRMRKE